MLLSHWNTKSKSSSIIKASWACHHISSFVFPLGHKLVVTFTRCFNWKENKELLQFIEMNSADNSIRKLAKDCSLTFTGESNSMAESMLNQERLISERLFIYLLWCALSFKQINRRLIALTTCEMLWATKATVTVAWSLCAITVIHHFIIVSQPYVNVTKRRLGEAYSTSCLRCCSGNGSGKERL